MHDAVVSLESLTAHEDWIRRLAGRLVSSPDAADDLVQDTWLVALQHPAQIESPAGRSWLASVVKNLARERWRKDARREARERRAAREEAGDGDAGTALEGFESCRAVMDHVLALPAAQRDLLIELYFERRTSAEVGASLGLSAGAVRNRHAAALQVLRRRLDAEHEGDRARWTHALVALALPSEATRPRVGWRCSPRGPSPRAALSMPCERRSLDSVHQRRPSVRPWRRCRSKLPRASSCRRRPRRHPPRRRSPNHRRSRKGAVARAADASLRPRCRATACVAATRAPAESPGSSPRCRGAPSRRCSGPTPPSRPRRSLGESRPCSASARSGATGASSSRSGATSRVASSSSPTAMPPRGPTLRRKERPATSSCG